MTRHRDAQPQLVKVVLSWMPPLHPNITQDRREIAAEIVDALLAAGGTGERERQLRDALLIALAGNPLCDDLADDDADATHLYDAGLLRLGRTISDEYYTTITDEGQEFIVRALASPSPVPAAGREDRE